MSFQPNVNQILSYLIVCSLNLCRHRHRFNLDKKLAHALREGSERYHNVCFPGCVWLFPHEAPHHAAEYAVVVPTQQSARDVEDECFHVRSQRSRSALYRCSACCTTRTQRRCTSDSAVWIHPHRLLLRACSACNDSSTRIRVHTCSTLF